MLACISYINRLDRSVAFHDWWSWIIAINAHSLIFIVLSSGTNGIEWKSLQENKLNKDFNWDEVFKTAFAKKEGLTLEKVTISTMFCKKSLLLSRFHETPLWPNKFVTMQTGDIIIGSNRLFLCFFLGLFLFFMCFFLRQTSIST